MNARARELADWLIAQVCGGPLPLVERDGARRWLEQAAAALGIIDVEAPDPFADGAFGYQASVFVAAIEGAALELLGETTAAYGQWRAIPDGNPAGLASLRRGSLVPVRDVNAAPREQLAAVPGLGPVSAGRIVAHRSVAEFTDLADVRRVSGVSLPAWERAVAGLSVDPSVTPRNRPEPLPVVRLAELGRRGRGPVVGVTGKGPGIACRAAFVLCCRQYLRRPVVPQFFAPNRARLRNNTGAIVRHREAAGFAAAGVALVRDGAYAELLPELIDSAQRSIRVAMFFLDGGSADVRGVLDRLAAARARGVAVRLVIGDDLPGDRHGAAPTNAEARRLLRQKDLPTRTHWPEMALHEKSVLVDDRWSLVGSHNWTPRSFFGAGETSVCVDSPALADDLQGRFDDLWRALHPTASRRRVSTSLLDELAPATRVRLQDQSLVRPAALTTDTDQQRHLARTAGLRVSALREAAAVAGLMEGLRVCETTAALLATSGMTTPAAVRAADLQAVRAALSRPLVTPARLAGRQVNPDLAYKLAEGDDRA